MALPFLATKVYIPPARPKVVARPRLIERLNAGHPAGGLAGVTLISGPAGFGKTTLVSEWVNQSKDEGRRLKDGELRLIHPSPSPAVRWAGSFSLLPSKVAWLSLDEGDNDPSRFLAYLVAALQTIAGNIGKGALGALQMLPPPSTESILTTLLNEITAVPDDFVLILDDYHVIEAKPVNSAITFLLEHLPPQMRLVLTTREDPDLPLAPL